MWLNDCKRPYEFKKLAEYNVNAKFLTMIKNVQKTSFMQQE